MKKIVIPALAALVACPAFAGQQYQTVSFWDTLNPYMALRVGAGYTNHNYSLNDEKESMSDEEMHGRLALGLLMGCNRDARAEIEWSVFTKQNDTQTFGDLQNVKVDTKLQTLLMNTYMDLGDYKMIRPFVGLGAGIAMSEVRTEVPGIAAAERDNTRFSAMGTLGVTFDWHVFAVDMALRYTYADINSGLHNFGGDVGLRYMF